MIRLRTLLSWTGLLLLLVCSSIACAPTSEEDAEASEEALGLTSCPTNLIKMIVRDERWTLFSPNVADNCMAKDGGASSPAELESHLAGHPFARLDQPAPFIQQCIAKYQQDTGRTLTVTQQKAVVSNFYFLFNTIKQNALATLEALATHDLLVDPRAGSLPEIEGVRYRHPLLHESGDWVRRLRRDCTPPAEGIEVLVATSLNVAWNARKLNAAIDSTLRSYGLESPDKFEQARNGLINTFAPWLVAPDMKDLTRAPASVPWEAKTPLQQLLEQETTYGIADAEGNVNPRSAWKRTEDPAHPLVVLERELRARLPKQLERNRVGLRKELNDLMRAAEWLAGSTSAGIDADEYQDILGRIVPFNLSTFHDYYDSTAVAARFDAPLRDLERKLGEIARGTNVSLARWVPGERLDPEQRLTQVESFAARLDPAKPGVAQLKAEAAALWPRLEDAGKGVASAAELAAAECRNALRSKRDRREQLAFEIGSLVAITAVTFGATWWLTAARAAMVVGNTARVASAIARTARMRAIARGAAWVARSGISYQTQARVIYGGLLAGDGYWMTVGIIDSVEQCSEKHISEQMMKFLDSPFDSTRSSCLGPSDAMGKQSIGSFRGCVFSVGVTAVSALISGYAAAKGYR